MMQFAVYAVSWGGSRVFLNSFYCEEIAVKFCEMNNWQWVDPLEPGYVWDLTIEEEEVEEDPYDEPDECGFDPYEGCYTWDC